MVDGTKHAQIGNTEGTSLEFLRLKFTITGFGGQGLNFLADLEDTLRIGVKNDGGEKALVSGDSYTHIDVVVLTNERIHPERVGFWDSQTSQSGGLDDKIVDGNLMGFAVFASFRGDDSIQFLADLKQFIDNNLGSQVVMRDGVLGFGKTFGNDLAHVGQWDVFEGTLGGGS